MPKAVKKESPQTNPFIGRPISKKFLTPCRRIGLSRKIATPINLNISGEGASVSKTKDGTPVKESVVLSQPVSTSTPIEKVQMNEGENNESDVIKEKNNKNKKRVSRCLAMEEEGVEKIDNEIVNISLNNDKQVIKETVVNKINIINSKANVDELDKPLANKRSSRNRKPISDYVLEDNMDQYIDNEISNKRNLRKTKTKTPQETNENTKQSKEKKKKTSASTSKNSGKNEKLNNSEEDFKENDNAFANKKIPATRKRGKNKGIEDVKENEDDEECVPNRKKKKLVIRDDSPLTVNKEKDDEPSVDKVKHKEDYADFVLNKNKNGVIPITIEESNTSAINFAENSEEQITSTPPKLSPKSTIVEIDNDASDGPPVLSPQVKKLKTYPGNKTSKQPIRRCLSLKKSSEDIDSVLIKQPNEVNIENCSIVSQELQQLEKEIHQKTLLVENLQQAEIYNKLHDIANLKELTSTYKEASILALDDLLRAKPELNVEDLLRTLNIPKEMIQLSPNGDLL